MLVALLLASSLNVAPPIAVQNKNSAGTCQALEVMKAAHDAWPVVPDPATGGQILPGAQSEGKGPAVLLPECRTEPQKRRKRKSDYPMA